LSEKPWLRWLHAPHKIEQAPEVFIIAGAFLEIDELADDLDVTDLIMTAAVDAVCRRQQVLVSARPVEVKWAANRAQPIPLAP
jgi:hypothetical protein